MTERKRHDMTGHRMVGIRVPSEPGDAAQVRARRALANLAAFAAAEAGLDLRPGATAAQLAALAAANPAAVARARRQCDLLADMLGLGPATPHTPGRCYAPGCDKELAMSKLTPSAGRSARPYCSTKCQRAAARARTDGEPAA